MKKIFLFIAILFCFSLYSQTSKEIIKEIKFNAVLHDFNENINNYYKIKEIKKVEGFDEDIKLLNNFDLAEFWPINFNFIGRVNDVFSEILVFFPKGFKSKHEIIYFNHLSKKIKNVYSFNKEENEYYILEYEDFLVFDSKLYSRDFKDKFLVIEKKELITLIEKLRELNNQITSFKKNLESSDFTLLTIQQKEIVNLNENGNYVNKARLFTNVFLSNANYEKKIPFDFSKSINIDGYKFNIDYKSAIDIKGKDLAISKIKGIKDENGNISAKITVQLNKLKLLKIDYEKLKQKYFSDWEGNFPKTDGESFYYYLDSKSINDLKEMNSDEYWGKFFNDDEKFLGILSISEMKFEELTFDSNYDFENTFTFPLLKFGNNEIYKPRIYKETKLNIEVPLLEFETNYSGGFFPEEMKYSLMSKLKRESTELYIDKSKKLNTIQGNKKFISDMTKKYGKKFVDDALNGNITIGMPEELLPIPLQAWVIKSREDYPKGYKLFCRFSLNNEKKLLITVIDKKVSKISNW